jgi:two-component system nitrogen regulation sensor histidine kinase NtrY
MPESLDRRGAARRELPADEVHRRRREAVLILVTAVVFVVFAVFETRLPKFSSGPSLSGNVIFFLLINLNLILLVLLVFLVSRNLVKLIFERRRRILGSRLRTRLVLAFVSLSLFPTMLLFLVAEGFLGTAIDNWFDVRVQNAMASSMEVAHRYYEQLGDDALHFARGLSREIEQRGLLDDAARADLRRFVESKRQELKLDGLQVLVGSEPVASSQVARLRARPAAITPEDLAALREGRDFARTQGAARSDVVRAGIPVRGPDGGAAGAVVVERVVPRSIARGARRTARSYEEYRQLNVLKQPIRNGYTLTFLLITLVVLFSGTWFGFYFAKGITVPIQRLGEGMREVAQGNWSYRAQSGGDEEIATLVTSFNRMTAELDTIHSALEERRRYIENILANITAGVVSVDRFGRLATLNPAAEGMLGIETAEVRGREWRQVFSRSDLKGVGELLARLEEGHQERAQRQIRLTGGPRVTSAWITATTLTDENGESHGIILFLEDVTYLLRVERMEAWREVARRIAHEIKNPLTPIQLSAQRLRKKYGTRLSGEEETLFEECTRTIIGQVEQLKRLVNEFSTFARLPAVEASPCDLNSLVEEAVVLFREAHREVDFRFAADPVLPLVEVDPDAVKRVIVNLLDNAVAACRDAVEGGRVELLTAYDPRVGAARLEISDNGAGMSAEVKARAFEPYFSTKKDGTGLGLAIVSAIVADHQAYLRMRDNEPRGTRLVVEFPLRRTVPLATAARA